MLLLGHSASADPIEPEVGASVGYGFLSDPGAYGGLHLAIGFAHHYEGPIDLRLNLAADFLLPTSRERGTASAFGPALEVDWRLGNCWAVGPRFALQIYRLWNSRAHDDVRPALGFRARWTVVMFGVDTVYASKPDDGGLSVIASASLTGRPGKYVLVASAVGIPVLLVVGTLLALSSTH